MMRQTSRLSSRRYRNLVGRKGSNASQRIRIACVSTIGIPLLVCSAADQCEQWAIVFCGQNLTLQRAAGSDVHAIAGLHHYVSNACAQLAPMIVTAECSSVLNHQSSIQLFPLRSSTISMQSETCPLG